MEGHLSPDRLMNVLSERGTPQDRQHVEVCSQCAEEIVRLRAALSTFGESVQRWAGHKNGSIPPDTAFVRVANEAAPARFRFALAVAAVLLAVMIPLYWHFPAAERNANAADDTVLLEEIDAGVSRAVPKAMESLAKPNDEPAQGEAR